MSALGKSGGAGRLRAGAYIDVPDLSTVWFKTPADNFCFAFETERCRGLQ